MVQLGDLCVFQRHVRLAEVSAGINHARIQKQPIEFVGVIVMKADVAGSLRPGLEFTLQRRRAACDGAQEMFSQTALGLPTFEAYGCFEIAFHVELSPNERGCRRIRSEEHTSELQSLR